LRETNFIQQNKEKWQEFEQILDGQSADPEKLNELFVQITDDLSYSRTFYPNRSVRVYLNSLAQRIFLQLYRHRRSQFRRLITFWTDELPLLVYESRRAFRLSALVFLLAFTIGVVSSFMDPEFPRVILGDRYVEMTLENIESGDPMAVYKEKGRLGMSLGITANNLFVAFLTFVLGSIFAIGTVAIMISNGIMVGSFQYFFIEQGLFRESFLTIWTHGTLEISAIIIAGAAGITMGRGLVFPGTLTRIQAFQHSARRGLKIMIGITPIIILAGFIEGFLTRYTETPDLVRGVFILICLLFVLTYFVWYPVMKARNPKWRNRRDPRVLPMTQEHLNFSGILSPGEIFASVFVFFKRQSGRIITTSLITTALYCLGAFGLAQRAPTEIFTYPNRILGTLSVINQFFVNPQMPLLPLVNLLVFAILTSMINGLLIREYEPGRPSRPVGLLLNALKMMAGLAVMQLVLWTNQWFTVFLVLFLFGIPMLWNFVMQLEKRNLLSAMQRALFLLSGNYGRMLNLFLVLSMTSLLFFSILDTVILSFYLDLISWLVQLEPAAMDQLSVIVLTFTSVLLLHLLYGLLISGIGMLYFSLREIKEAPHLQKRIHKIGQRQEIQGMLREEQNGEA